MDFKVLQKWNKTAAIVHGLATVVSFILLSTTSQENRLITMSRLEYNDDGPPPTSKVDLPVRLVQSGETDLRMYVVGFFAITAVAHWLYATDFFGRGWYSAAIFGYGWNPYRWFEYSLSAGLMTYLILIISGTKEQVSAVSAALITPSLMLSGLTTERALDQNALHAWSVKGGPKPRIDPVVVWANILPAWLLFFTKWYVILSNYSKISKEAKEASRPVDPSVSFVVRSMFIFFALFGLIMSYQTYRWATSRVGRPEPSFVAYEKAYIVLSALAKLVLAGAVVYAVKD